MLSIGIDPGTHTGVSLMSSRGKNKFKVEEADVFVNKEEDPVKRGSYIADMVLEFIKPTHRRLNESGVQICIEGYGFARTSNLEPTFCIGTLLRYKLWQYGFKYTNVSPNSLKKLVTGHGNCNKNVIMKELYKNWEIDTDNDNQADAHGLALFGLAMHDLIKVPKTNYEAIIKVRDK